LAAKRQGESRIVEHRRQEGEHAQDESGDASSIQKEKKAEYLTAQQLAEVLQISEATVHRLRRAGRIPAVMLTDRLIRFNLRDVQRALRPQRRQEDLAADEGDATSSAQLSFDDFDSKFDLDQHG
jgi:excisionase family DNA binding protein